MTPAEYILSFTLGGIGLRAAIAWLKNKLKATGILAQLLSIVCCGAACAIYILLVQTFNLPLATWADFPTLFLEVFIGAVLTYQATKRR